MNVVAAAVAFADVVVVLPEASYPHWHCVVVIKTKQQMKSYSSHRHQLMYSTTITRQRYYHVGNIVHVVDVVQEVMMLPLPSTVPVAPVVAVVVRGELGVTSVELVDPTVVHVVGGTSLLLILRSLN